MTTTAPLDAGQVTRCVAPDCGRQLAGPATAKALGIAIHDSAGLCRTCATRRRRGHDDQVRPRPSITRITQTDTTWMAAAACRGMDTDAIFFPLSEGDTIAARHAKTICAACPVQTNCLLWALDALTHGIAGGLTAEERRRHRREALARAGDPS